MKEESQKVYEHPEEIDRQQAPPEVKLQRPTSDYGMVGTGSFYKIQREKSEELSERRIQKVQSKNIQCNYLVMTFLKTTLIGHKRSYNQKR